MKIVRRENRNFDDRTSFRSTRAIVHNVNDFMMYHSSFKSDFVNSGRHRPVVTVCSDSMHSKMLKNRLYPNVTDLELRHFYGHKYGGDDGKAFKNHIYSE